jgi:hypothetical protein
MSCATKCHVFKRGWCRDCGIAVAEPRVLSAERVRRRRCMSVAGVCARCGRREAQYECSAPHELEEDRNDVPCIHGALCDEKGAP